MGVLLPQPGGGRRDHGVFEDDCEMGPEFEAMLTFPVLLYFFTTVFYYLGDFSERCGRCWVPEIVRGLSKILEPFLCSFRLIEQVGFFFVI